MNLLKRTSEKKQKLIDSFNSTLNKGDSVYVKKNSLTSYKSDSYNNKTDLCEIVKYVSDNEIHVKKDKSIHTITKSDIVEKAIYGIGENPFDEDFNRISALNYSLESILFNLNILDEKQRNYDIDGVLIKELNWNPFVYDKDGNKQHYQRDFVWSLKEKQLLIESIYNNIDCGKILVRKRGWDELKVLVKNGETEIAFNDIIDGKQRLNTLKSFILDEFQDLHGNYYSDLSFKAQNSLTNNQLISFSELPKNTEDKTVIKQFLRLNFTGIPQSEEHIEYVKNISKKL
jgi:hypothetical protein